MMLLLVLVVVCVGYAARMTAIGFATAFAGFILLSNRNYSNGKMLIIAATAKGCDDVKPDGGK